VSRVRILTVLEHYLPGTKSGGPLRSIGDLVDCLGDTFQFDILTRDRDIGDRGPYPRVDPGAWYPVGKARVRYLGPAERTLRGWRTVLRSSPGNVIYLNGVFAASSMKILLLRRLGLAPRVPVVIAPRCELHPGAISIKPRRKDVWLRLSRQLGLFEGVTWQAATPDESDDIRRVVGGRHTRGQPTVRVARQITHDTAAARWAVRDDGGGRGKRPGHARVVFVSRISRKKNLDYALRVLAEVPGRVEFDIYGPLEDERYWAECASIIDRMPPTVSVRYRGRLEPHEVGAVFGQYHLFLFPTRGESFGHVVFESLLAGCPLLLSDRTPWRGVATARAGWVVPLHRPAAFVSRITEVVEMDSAALAGMSAAARTLALEIAADDHPAEENRQLFAEAASGVDGGK